MLTLNAPPAFLQVGVDLGNAGRESLLGPDEDDVSIVGGKWTVVVATTDLLK